MFQPLSQSDDEQSNEGLKVVSYKRIRYRRLEKTCNFAVGLIVTSVILLLILYMLEINGYLTIHGMIRHIYPQTQMIQKFKTDIKKPQTDKKSYEYLVMNGLKVLLIQDPDAELTNAALCVYVGSWMDPIDHQGLAHFLEHMLFQGSEKYPEPGYFQQQVSQSGHSNAYTRVDETNYYFTVSESQLTHILDVFAHFFVDPLLAEDQVKKEINAVNSEYKIGVSSDGWKFIYALKQVTKDDHPFHKFSTGNIETLTGSQEAMRAFHDQHYSSNLMSLVIRSKNNIKDYIMQSDFVEIENKHLQKYDYKTYGMPFVEHPQILKYRIDKQSRVIKYTFQVQSPLDDYKSNSLQFLDSIIQSKHEGGLHEYLKVNNYSLEMETETMFEQNGFTFYLIEVVQSQDTNPESILQMAQSIYAYFNEMIEEFFESVNDSEIEETQLLIDLWDQSKKIHELKFNYQPEDIEVQQFSSKLNKYPADHVLTAEVLYEKMDPENIYEYLIQLSNPKNLQIIIGDSRFKYTQENKNENFKDSISYVKSLELSQRNERYNLDFDKRPVSQEDLEFITQPLQSNNILQQKDESQQKYNFQLPSQNKYVPMNLKIKSLCDSKIYQNYGYQSIKDCQKNQKKYESLHKYPIKLSNQVFWRLQRNFQSPQIYYAMKLNSQFDSVNSQALAQVLATYWEEILDSKFYQAKEAGYSLSVSYKNSGLQLEIYGWSDNFKGLTQSFVQKIKQQTSEKDVFQRSVQIAKQNNLMQYSQRLFSHALSIYLPNIIMENNFTPELINNEIDKLSIENLNQFQKQYFQDKSTISYATGNVLQKEIMDLQRSLDKHSSQYKDYLQRVIKLDKNYKVAIKSNDMMNTVALHYHQIGERNIKNYAIMSILQGWISNRSFQVLRTEQQLGYVAKAKFHPYECVDSLMIFVQGTDDPQVISQSIDAFLLQAYEELQQMDDESFNELKEGSITKLSQPEKTLYDEGRSFWDYIQKNYLEFEEQTNTLKMIQEITRDDALKLMQQTQQNGSINLLIYGQKQQQLSWPQDSPDFIYDLGQLKSSTSSYFECSHGLTSII